jgi:hypothetical protein
MGREAYHLRREFGDSRVGSVSSLPAQVPLSNATATTFLQYKGGLSNANPAVCDLNFRMRRKSLRSVRPTEQLYNSITGGAFEQFFNLKRPPILGLTVFYL